MNQNMLDARIIGAVACHHGINRFGVYFSTEEGVMDELWSSNNTNSGAAMLSFLAKT